METLPNLFMREGFAPPQGILASLHRILEMGFLFKITRKNILH